MIADKRPFLKTLYSLFLTIGAAMVPVAFLSDKVLTECNMLFGNIGGGQFESIQATLKSVFHHVRAFRAHYTPTVGNAIFFASQVPLNLSPDDEAPHKKDETRFAENGTILTDNYNPIDIMSANIHCAVSAY